MRAVTLEEMPEEDLNMNADGKVDFEIRREKILQSSSSNVGSEIKDD